jgi:hypothetical protein
MISVVTVQCIREGEVNWGSLASEIESWGVGMIDLPIFARRCLLLR